MKKIIASILTVILIITLFPYDGFALENGTLMPLAEPKLVALTFDDGPCNDTNRLLDGLKDRGVHVTFFMVGSNAASYPSIVKRCYEEGHEIANHSYNHEELTKQSDYGKSTVTRTNSTLTKAIGAENRYLVRPPYGSNNQRVLNVIGVPAIYWSVDPQDWATSNSDTVSNRIVRDAFDGAIILVHDIHKSSVTGALKAIDTLTSRGYEFVTVSELFRRRGKTLEAGNIYYSAKPSGKTLPAISTPEIVVGSDLSGTTVTIKADAGTRIWYTTDGTIPNANSNVYSGPISLSKKTTIKAVAGYDMNGSRSNVAEKEVAAAEIPAPTISIAADGTVTLSASNSIYYTTDGKTPSATSRAYTGPFRVIKGTQVKAVAIKSGTEPQKSKEVWKTYSENGNVYTDVTPSAWYYQAVDACVTQNIMRGTKAEVFSPETEVTRAMVVTTLYRISGEPAGPWTSALTDVKTGEWYSDAVAWGEQNHIVQGYPDKTFKPHQTVTRQELATFLMRYYEYQGNTVTTGTAIDSFSDKGSIAQYALQPMNWAVEAKLINGVSQGVLSPRTTATRAQLATILQRYLSSFSQ